MVHNKTLYYVCIVVALFFKGTEGKVIFPDEIHFDMSAVLNKNCGDTPYTDRLRPENGRVFENPWLVLFQNPDEEDAFCQGTLITARHVLTTAICTEAVVLNETNLIFGNSEQPADKNCDSGSECIGNSKIILQAHRMYVHPGFKNDSYENDIALVTLSKRVTYTNSVKPICLPLVPIIPGRIHNPIIYNILSTENGRAPKQVRMNHIPIPVCQNLVQDLLVLREGQLCAHFAQPTDANINAGSGSPLVVEHHDRMFQIGILSIGFSQATINDPYIYVNVSTHVNWIHNILVGEPTQ